MSLGRVKEAIGRRLDRLMPRTWLALRIARRDPKLDPEYWLVPDFCDRDHIAVDIGANRGEYSYWMARHARSVVAFEPNTDLWPSLARLAGRKVRLEGAALSRVPGQAAFRYVESNTGVATVEPSNVLSMVEDRATVRQRAVELRTLDSYSLDEISFIKIDVEGHEEAVIEGARETLRRSRPVLLIESEDRHNPGAPMRLASLMASLDYAGFFLRAGKLTGIAAITARERDAANVGTGDYVYNYLFIPVERADLIAELAGRPCGARFSVLDRSR